MNVLGFTLSPKGVRIGFGLARAELIALLLAAILFHFVVAGWSELLANVNSNETDQNAFLHVGLKIRAREGLTDGNRHPLFPALISLFAERDWTTFTRAKLLSFAISVLGLIVVFWLSQRLYNTPVALGTVFLLSIGSDTSSTRHGPRQRPCCRRDRPW